MPSAKYSGSRLASIRQTDADWAAGIDDKIEQSHDLVEDEQHSGQSSVPRGER
jgi:hypothetical protein